MVADLHHFDEDHDLDPDPDPHQSEKQGFGSAPLLKSLRVTIFEILYIFRLLLNHSYGHIRKAPHKIKKDGHELFCLYCIQSV